MFWLPGFSVFNVFVYCRELNTGIPSLLTTVNETFKIFSLNKVNLLNHQLLHPLSAPKCGSRTLYDIMDVKRQYSTSEALNAPTTTQNTPPCQPSFCIMHAYEIYI